jgi:nucleoside-diphosphate-sugar epimerase
MTAEDPTALVTGGTGLIGRAIVRRLIALGYTVRVLSRRQIQNSGANPRIIRGDVRTSSDVRSAMLGCDVVFHCAAEKNDRALMQSVNHDATGVIFEAANELKIRLLCHLSSVAVVGKTDRAVIDEESPCHPMSRYGETKLAAEQIATKGLPNGAVVVLRPTIVFCAETLIPLFRRSAKQRVLLFLKGNEYSHWVYAEDVAAAALHWIDRSAPGSVETFIVSCDDEKVDSSNRAVQGFLANIYPQVPRSPRFCAPSFVPQVIRALTGRPGNSGRIIYSSGKLRRAGFNFPFGLINGLRHASGALQAIGAAQ